MAKGAIAKQAIFEKLLEVFNGSFMYANGKELRIPWEEESGPVQIKVTLTAAKDMVSPEGEVMRAAATASEPVPMANFMNSPHIEEPTEEEKQTVQDLLKTLGLA